VDSVVDSMTGHKIVPDSAGKTKSKLHPLVAR